MILNILSNQEYQNLLQELEMLKKENAKLKELVNSKQDMTFVFSSDVKKGIDLKYKFNNINFSNGLQDAFIKYVNDISKPITLELKKEIAEKVDELKKDIQNTKTNQLNYVCSYLHENIPEVIKTADELKKLCDSKNIIKLVRCDDTKEFANCIINTLNTILNNIPTIKDCENIVDNKIENFNNLDFEEKEIEIENL